MTSQNHSVTLTLKLILTIMSGAEHSMRCIVINLPRASIRRRSIQQQFDSLEINFELLEAVDWRDLSNQERMLVDRRAREREGRRPLSDGMIACHLSHRKAIECVARGNEDFTAIFEDDVKLAPQIKSVFSILECADRPAKSFDILFLHRNKTSLPYLPVHKLDENYSFGAVKYCDWGAQSYIMSKTGARRFLDFYPKIIHRCDHTLHEYWDNGLKIFSLDPPVAFHENEDTRVSFIREAAATRPPRSLLKYPHRVRSLVREEVRKRLAFYRLARTRTRNGE